MNKKKVCAAIPSAPLGWDPEKWDRDIWDDRTGGGGKYPPQSGARPVQQQEGKRVPLGSGLENCPMLRVIYSL